MKKTFPIVLVTLFLATGVFAESGQPGNQFFKPSASAFKVFMNQLYERTNCRDRLIRNNNPDICSESISYDSNENLIHIYFRIPPDYIWLENFTRLNMEARKKILTDLTINTAINMGVGVRDDMVLSSTLIHSIPVRGEFASPGISEERFKRQIAERIVVHLRTVKENMSYRITRDPQGKITLAGDAFEQLN